MNENTTTLSTQSTEPPAGGLSARGIANQMGHGQISTTQDAYGQPSRPDWVTDHSAAPRGSGGEHPAWCDRAFCTRLTNDERPTFIHRAVPQQWRVGDMWVRLELNHVFEPGEPDDEPVITLRAGASDDAVIFTVPAAIDLIRRVRHLVDLAENESGGRTS